MRFSKKADVFDPSCRLALLTVAKPEGGLALYSPPKAEKLVSNLFLLGGYPSEILVTPTVAKVRDTFFAELGNFRKPWLREMVWKERCFIRSSTLSRKAWMSCLPKNPRECRSPHGQRLKTWCYSGISRNCSARRSSSVAANKACC